MLSVLRPDGSEFSHRNNQLVYYGTQGPFGACFLIGRVISRVPKKSMLPAVLSAVGPPRALSLQGRGFRPAPGQV